MLCASCRRLLLSVRNVTTLQSPLQGFQFLNIARVRSSTTTWPKLFHSSPRFQSPSAKKTIRPQAKKFKEPREEARASGGEEVVMNTRRGNAVTPKKPNAKTAKTAEEAPKKPSKSESSHNDTANGAPSESKPRTSNSKRSPSKESSSPANSKPPPKPRKETWQTQKAALTSKFPTGWAPRKRLSPDAMDGIRALHAQDSSTFTTAMLAEHFKVSPEAIRRILKSKWLPSEEEQEDRRRRWDKRGERIWSRLAELGTRPPKRWREMGVGRVEGGGVPAWKKSQLRERREDVPWAEGMAPAEGQSETGPR